MIKLTSTLAALAILATAPAAVAGEFGTIPQSSVKYSDLNLSSSSGRATLDRRIKTAARQVCRHLDTGSAGGAADFMDCVQSSINRANTTLASVMPKEVAAR